MEVEAKMEMEEGKGEERGRGGDGEERIHQEMCAASHQRIRMVIKMASKICVFFSLLTRDNNSTVTIIKLIYSFKQNQAAAPSATPSGGSPACKIWYIHQIHAVVGANDSPWWGGWGLFGVLNNAKKVYYSHVGFLQSNSFWFPLERTCRVLVPAGTDLAVKQLHSYWRS